MKRLLYSGYHNTFHRWGLGPVTAMLTAFFAGAWETATPLLEEFVLIVWTEIHASLEYWAFEENKGKVQQLVESQGIKCSIHVY